MKTLLILRHAKSSWKDEELPDHDRPLNKRGKREAPLMGRLLADEDLLPNIILCSTAKRAKKTAARVIKSSGYAGPIEFHRELYAAPPAEHVVVVRQFGEPHGRVMLVGHNPGLEELLAALIDQHMPLETATLAQVEVDIDSWRELTLQSQGKLINVWCPGDLE